MGKRWGHIGRHPLAAPLLLYKEPLLPLTTHSSLLLSYALWLASSPLDILSSSRAWCLGEALLKIFSITTTMSLCWRSSVRSTTSAAQLEQGAEVVADPYV